MRDRPILRAALFSAGIALTASTMIAVARADTGPCLDDGHGSLICGNGAGAARVIEGSISPSKRFALAWRSTGAAPSEQPLGDLEDLVIRLADGAVLEKHPGEYWATVDDGYVNRIQEWGSWSSNSRWLIRTLDERWDSSMVDVFVFDTGGNLTGPFNLLGVMKPALSKELKVGLTNDGPYSFRELDGKPFTIDNSGLVHASVMIYLPKKGPEYDCAVTLQVTQKSGAIDARILSIRLLRHLSTIE